MFFLISSLDALHLVISICLIAVTIFVCWALYELIKIMHQTDEIISDARSSVTQLQDTVESIVEKLTSVAGVASIVTGGGKQLLSMLGSKKRKPVSKNSRRRVAEDEEVDE